MEAHNDIFRVVQGRKSSLKRLIEFISTIFIDSTRSISRTKLKILSYLNYSNAKFTFQYFLIVSRSTLRCQTIQASSSFAKRPVQTSETTSSQNRLNEVNRGALA